MLLNAPSDLSLKKFKVIIFDLDGTLYDQRKMRLRMAKQLFLYYILRPHRLGELITLYSFRRERERRANASKEIPKAIEKWIFYEPLKYMRECRYPALADLFNNFKRKGKKVAVLSDYPPEGKMRALELDADLLACSTDEAIDSFKPDPRGFLYIAGKFNALPHECLVIGDREEKDGEGARRAGMAFLHSSNFIAPGRANISWKKILLIALVSAAVGFIYTFPDILRFKSLAQENLEYAPYTLIRYADETMYYGPRIRDVLDGNFIVSEIDSYEYRDGPYRWPPLNPLLVAPFFLFHDSFGMGLIISAFFFSILFFWLFYYLAFILFGRNVFFAFLCTAVFIFFSHFGELLPPSSLGEVERLLQAFLSWQVGSPSLDLFMTRRESVLPALTFLLISHIGFIELLKRPSWKWICLAGISFGLLFYSYVFYWVGFSVFLGVCGIFFLAHRQYESLKRYVMAFLIGLVISIPFWINLYHLYQIPWIEELNLRIGTEFSRSFRLSMWKEYTVWILLALSIYSLGKKQKWFPESLYISALVITPIILLNLQVVLGMNILPEHWVSRFTWIGLGLAWFALIFLLMKRWASFPPLKYAPIIMITASLTLTLHAGHAQWLDYKKVEINSYTLPEPFLESFDWLTENTPKDSVIVTPSLVTNYLIPLYTHNRIFMARAVGSLASSEEIIERMLTVYKYLELPSQHLAHIFNNDINRIVGKDADELEDYEDLGIHFAYISTFFPNGLDESFKGFPLADYQLPDSIYKEIQDKYASYRNISSLTEVPYRADYLYIGPFERRIIPPAQLTKIKNSSELVKLYDKDSVEIYQLIK